MKIYVVMGFYSREEREHPEYIDEFAEPEDAENCVLDFESVSGRLAWIETI